MLNLDKDSYTKDEILELFKPFETEIIDLKTSVIEGNKAVEKIKELEKDSLTNTIKLEAIKAGLNIEEVFDLIDSDSIEKAQAKITKLADMQKQQKINNLFRPDDKHKPSDEYANAEKNGDVQGMLKSKLSRLFQ